LPSMPAAVVLVVAGFALLLGGGKLSETGAVAVAKWAGLSDALIGLTIVAFATSLPELATSLAAVRKNHADLAVGNVVGSNLCNLLLVLGATATIKPVPVPALGSSVLQQSGWFDLGMMIVITFILLVFAKTHSITRRKGVFLLACYGIYMAFGVAREIWL
ncbi:MAG: sodium:calcium antiporter, partial [Planctomycetota bacterium]